METTQNGTSDDDETPSPIVHVHDGVATLPARSEFICFDEYEIV
jgi:hypothetical protein